MKTGGRGKAGGVKLAADPDEAQQRAEAILGLDIKGHVVGRVLITPASEIAEEYYVSYLLDRANRTFLAMASVEGGMDIEEVAATKPEALAKVPIDPIAGVDAAKARRSSRPPGSRTRWPSRPPTCSSSCGKPSSPRTRRWSR